MGYTQLTGANVVIGTESIEFYLEISKCLKIIA